MNDFNAWIKNAVNGDVSAIRQILNAFKENQITQNESEQLHVVLKASQSDYAIYLRGMLYQFGYGVQKDNDMAFLLLRESAGKGNGLATYAVAKIYMEGDGVSPNYEMAVKWLRLAAGSPYYIADAMFDLGQLYEAGLGVTADSDEANNWYQKAADKHHPDAIKKLTSHK